MKLKKILFAGVAAGAVALTLASCGGPNQDPLEPTDTDEKIYNKVFGDFYTLYKEAKKETTDLNKRYANMAVSEAKLLETGTILPTTTRGGQYALTRVVPRTVNGTLWGNDSDRLHKILVTNENIKKTDRDALIAIWNLARVADVVTEADYIGLAKTYLAAHQYTIKNEYNWSYTSDPNTYDVLATSEQADSQVIVQGVDGLLEYNELNKQDFAIAKSLEVSSDKKKFTFELKQGVKWVDKDGNEVAEVKADDFVAGFQHMLDAEGGLESLTYGVIKGAAEYAESKDFSKVGVKADGDYKVVYELEEVTPYFQTMFAYSMFSPMNRTYYESKGGKFGEDFDATADDYKYGTTYSDILYNGPFRITDSTKETQIVFEKNEKYYGKDALNVNKVTWKYNDGKVATKAYDDFKNGVIDNCALTSATITNAKNDNLFNTYAYISDTEATTFINFFNVNRQAFTTDGLAPTTKSKDQKLTMQIASLNQNLRLALQLSVNRKASNAISTGDDLAELSLRNSYTPYNFVTLTAATTVKINGKDVTFPAGTNYGEVIQKTLEADGSTIKAYDAEKKSGDGYDGWYNPTEAKKRLDAALPEINKELEAKGLKAISAENPLVVEYPTQSSSDVYMGKAQVLKQSVESALGGLVKVEIISLEQRADWLKVCYSYSNGKVANFDINDLSGWGPDYGDPQTYLDTMLPYGDGYMLKALGLW